MAHRSRTTLDELRTAVRCLPRSTRIAMLQGLATNDIVVGAYTHDSGICPMLAAHRAGGRTSYIGFARAWDRFAFRRSHRRHARRATDRELLILRTHLQASLLEDDGPAGDLQAAIAEHQALTARAITAPEPLTDPGWRWIRVMKHRRSRRQLAAR